MKKLSFFFLFAAEKTVCSRSYYYYGYHKEDPYAESPCYSDNHNCHPTENCVPEGQHLYQCCDMGYKYDYSTHCRQGNPHPCLEKNTCNDGEFCHRIVKPNEETNDYECIKKDDKCIGVAMCTEFYQGSCSANNKEEKQPIRIAVKSVDDCYNECKNNEECKGFDLDEKGGCLLAFQDCREKDLDKHPIFEKYSDHKDFYYYYQEYYWKDQSVEKKQLSYTYYPMKGCFTPERDEDCDKTLADHLEDIYFDLLGRMDKLAPVFLAQFAKKKDRENEEREFRKKVIMLVTVLGSILVVLAFIFVVFRIVRSSRKADPGVQMTENRQHHQNPAPISDSSVTGVVAPFPFNDSAPTYSEIDEFGSNVNLAKSF
ncbi:Oidioi.mRNA.OKI2018_I69.PAR.g9983.t1.cds [Oikopleura dioica]|uniref:Oidioi.mRNA.OKI2018_I69.PAR.g9983.t1.cds n=1 Tax=Oikopleura dioica TaxID=34765 RepID=A0ABN7RSE2_OIKDI|nr:Oidioi.mRNA.OKI2018_I69.PAR.g9983.t1.cds [Oikopleura dioica]